MNKNKIKNINTILFELWDPISINDNPNLSDEYKNYSYSLLKMTTKDEIIDHLKYIEDDMSCWTTDEVKNKVAKKIIALSETH